MHPFVIDPHHLPPPSALTGAVITQALRVPGGGRLRKGQVIDPAALDLIARLDHPVHAIRLDPGEIHEDEAARRLAALAIGSGLTAREPVQSRVNIIAATKGLLRVDPEAVEVVNRHEPLALFTVLDRLPVVPGKIVAGAKIGTVAMPEATLRHVEELVASRKRPILQVKPYQPHLVGVVVTEGLAEKLRDRFEQSVRQKMSWYGSRILRFDYVPNQRHAVSTAIEALLADGASLILTAGGNMMDPLDPTLVAMPDLAAEVVRLGAPAHPGSMFWLADLNTRDTSIVNLASCSMYSKATVADLVLPWIMAGERVTSADIASLGYGGLLDRDMGWRFPNYEIETVDEPDEI